MLEIQIKSRADFAKYYFLGTLKQFEDKLQSISSGLPFIKACRAKGANPPMIGDKIIWYYIRATDISLYREME